MTPTERREIAGLVVMFAVLAAMAVAGKIIEAESKAAAIARQRSPATSSSRSAPIQPSTPGGTG